MSQIVNNLKQIADMAFPLLPPWIRYTARWIILSIASATLRAQLLRRYGEYEQSVMDHEDFQYNYEDLYGAPTDVHLDTVYALDLLEEWKKNPRGNSKDFLWQFLIEQIRAEKMSTIDILKNCSKVYIEYLDAFFDAAQCKPRVSLASSLGFNAFRYSELHASGWLGAGGKVSDAHLNTFRWLSIDDVKECLTRTRHVDNRTFLFHVAISAGLDDDVVDELEQCLIDSDFIIAFAKFNSDVCISQSIANYVTEQYIQRLAEDSYTCIEKKPEEIRFFENEQDRFIIWNADVVALFVKLSQKNVYKPVNPLQVASCLMALPYSDEKKAEFENYLRANPLIFMKGLMTKAAC